MTFQSALQLTHIYESENRNCYTKIPWTEPFQEIRGSVSVITVQQLCSSIQIRQKIKKPEQERNTFPGCVLRLEADLCTIFVH